MAVPLAAAACGEDDEATDTQPLATAGPSPTANPTALEAEAQRLLSLAPTADEFGAAFPDLAPFEQGMGGFAGQEWERVDLAKHGYVLLAGVSYRTPDETNLPFTAYISLVSFGDASGASGAMAELIAKEFSYATFEVGMGEEAYGISESAVLLRQGRVVAFLVIADPNGEDRREGMRQLARDLAGRIEDAPAQ